MTTTRRLFIANFAGACFVAWAWVMGYVTRLLAADGAHMTLVIGAVFAYGLAATFWFGSAVDARLKQNMWCGGERALAHAGLQRNTAHLHDLFTALLMLGVVGNAIGFLSAFGGIDIASLTTPEGMRAAGAQLLAGSGTAFGSTIVGLTLALWTMVNLRILATAIDRLAPHA
jgi:hypothetical protein